MQNKSLAIPLAILGIALLIVGILLQSHNEDFFSNAIQTRAKVEEVTSREREDEDNRTYYKIRVNYTVDNKDYTESFEIDKRVREGNFITVYYNAENPSECHLDSKSYSGYFFIICGILLLISSIVTYIKYNK